MLSIIMIGDIIGKPGRSFLQKALPAVLRRHKADLVIANGENAAGGKGITESIAKELHETGVDILTMGNHTWDNPAVFDFIDSSPGLIRPANYPASVPGKGWIIHEIKPGIRPVAVVNLMGRSFMTPIDCPFHAADRLLEEIREHAPGDKEPVVIVDFHAEATSEKETMGFYLAGRVAAVIGTHTHVQTADERILEGGTAYITDAGMTGPRDSVLGIKPEIMIRRFVHQLPVRHELAGGPSILCGVLVEVDESSGRAVSITRIMESD